MPDEHRLLADLPPPLRLLPHCALFGTHFAPLPRRARISPGFSSNSDPHARYSVPAAQAEPMNRPGPRVPEQAPRADGSLAERQALENGASRIAYMQTFAPLTCLASGKQSRRLPESCRRMPHQPLPRPWLQLWWGLARHLAASGDRIISSVIRCTISHAQPTQRWFRFSRAS